MEAAELATLPVSRRALMALQHAAHEQPGQLDLEEYVTHWFAPGVYARQFDLPEGSMVVGKIHRHAHLNLLLTGVVRVASEFHTETFAAPRVWVSEPGIKRAVYTLEDAMWITIHPNPDNTRDEEELEAEVIAPDYEQLDAFLRKQLEEG